MKTRAWILTVILGVVILQPPFTNFNASAMEAACAKTKTLTPASCSKSSCDNSLPAEEENDCEKRCNPLLGCSTGNFYIHNYYTITLTEVLVPKPKTALVNDNRTLDQLRECWNPPEIN